MTLKRKNPRLTQPPTPAKCMARGFSVLQNHLYRHFTNPIVSLKRQKKRNCVIRKRARVALLRALFCLSTNILIFLTADSSEWSPGLGSCLVYIRLKVRDRLFGSFRRILFSFCRDQRRHGRVGQTPQMQRRRTQWKTHGGRAKAVAGELV